MWYQSRITYIQKISKTSSNEYIDYYQEYYWSIFLAAMHTHIQNIF